MTTGVDTLRTTAYAAIRRKIVSGVLAPGDRVSELSLSKELGMSRAPVREACNRLASDGVLLQVSGFGTFVRLPSEAEVAELFDFRAALESFAARRAAEAMGPRPLAALRKECREQAALIGAAKASGVNGLKPETMARWARSNDAFHAVVLELGGNSIMHRHLADMNLFRSIFTRYFSSTFVDGDARGTGATPVVTLLLRNLREHRRIVEALRRREPAAASEAMRDHLESAKSETLEQMRRDAKANAGAEPPAYESLTRVRRPG